METDVSLGALRCSSEQSQLGAAIASTDHQRAPGIISPELKLWNDFQPENPFVPTRCFQAVGNGQFHVVDLFDAKSQFESSGDGKVSIEPQMDVMTADVIASLLSFRELDLHDFDKLAVLLRLHNHDPFILINQSVG